MTNSVHINFVGDIALFRHFEIASIDPINEVWLPKSDYNIANFEFVIPEHQREKLFFDVNDEYSVSYEYLHELNVQRFNAYSLANNHSLDYGVEGAEDVINYLDQNEVASFGFGTSSFNVHSFALNGIKFSIVGFVKNGRWDRGIHGQTGPDTYDTNEIVSEIKRLKNSNDHVLVFPHWGTELVDSPSPEDCKNAKLFIEAGASAIIGHHPHIIQGIEEYAGSLIAYSLGSFIYIPESEVGYLSKGNQNRNYSICLSIEFSKDAVLAHKPYFFKYSPSQKIPVTVEDSTIDSYFCQLNNDLQNPGLYYKKIRKQLIKRELIGFAQRFRSSPLKTIVYYLGYIKFEHFRKLIK